MWRFKFIYFFVAMAFSGSISSACSEEGSPILSTSSTPAEPPSMLAPPTPSPLPPTPKPPERFTIQEIMPSKEEGGERARILVKNINGSLMTVAEDAGYKLGYALSFGHGFQGAMDPTYWHAGAEQVFDGKVSFLGYTFDSDPSYPLTFKLTWDAGFVYLCGRGTITSKDGETHQLGYQDTVDTWLHFLDSEDLLYREGAAQALGWLAITNDDKDRAVPALIKALMDVDMEVRRNAAEALGRLNDQRSVVPLREAFNDSDEWVAEVAAEALEKIDSR